MSASIVTVYTPGFKSVLNLPKQSVFHIPEGPNSRLVLCANFDASNPVHSCTMGSACRFVHADTSAAREQNIHVNYAWRSIDEVSYERLPAGQILRVAPPNSKAASDVMDSDMVLKTRALTSHRRPLSHCAHYYFNRTCNLGAECQFIHAVFIDPNAKPFQRAPVPSQLGEGRELQLSKKQREAQQNKHFGLPTALLGDSASESLTGRAAIAHKGSPAASESSTPRSTGTGSSTATKYRYDPYSPSSKVVLCIV